MLDIKKYNEDKLAWNVIYGDFNRGTIEVYNIFQHGSFLESCKKNYKKNSKNKDEFIEQLRMDLHYYFWSKCEWEVIISHWPSAARFHDSKIDVWDQIALNWNQFTEYVWDNKEKLKSSDKQRTM